MRFCAEQAVRIQYHEKSTRIDGALRQSVAVVKIVQTYLAKLKETNSYDNSLIIVMSDHGFRQFPETSFDSTNAYRSLLLVKRPSQHRDILQVTLRRCTSKTQHPRY
ncbi:MAG: DUF229 domain-containing protein [Planctomycetaceae bacterium]|nr:DUF229 domain-containing protein [Planctomycetaceae bacterium]